LPLKQYNLILAKAGRLTGTSHAHWPGLAWTRISRLAALAGDWLRTEELEAALWAFVTQANFLRTFTILKLTFKIICAEEKEKKA